MPQLEGHKFDMNVDGRMVALTHAPSARASSDHAVEVALHDLPMVSDWISARHSLPSEGLLHIGLSRRGHHRLSSGVGTVCLQERLTIVTPIVIDLGPIIPR